MKAGELSLMIFAAGFGARMGELTQYTPKPMLPLAGKPMLDHAIALARDAGIDVIVANTHYLSEAIEPHLENLGVKHSREMPDILDTGGGLRAASELLTSPTLTLNPDAVWLGPNPLTALANAWRGDMQALLLLVPANRAHGHNGRGDFSIEAGRLKRGGSLIYSGAQIVRTESLPAIPDKAFSLNVIWDQMAEAGGLYGAEYPGQWCDIGSPEGLALAEQLLGARDV